MKFLKNLAKNDSGVALVLFAFLLPLFLLMVGLTVDGAHFYIRHSELENLTTNATNSGMIAFSQVLENQALANYPGICNVETPPAKCSSSNFYNFLTMEEIFNLANDIDIKNEIVINVINFGKEADPASILEDNHFTIEFPYDYVLGSPQISMRVEVSEKPNQFFSGILPNEKVITTQAISSLSLQ